MPDKWFSSAFDDNVKNNADYENKVPLSTDEIPDEIKSIQPKSWREKLNYDSGIDVFNDIELEKYRKEHIFFQIIPVIDRLLFSNMNKLGFGVFLADETGRMLWVENAKNGVCASDPDIFVPGKKYSNIKLGYMNDLSKNSLDLHINISLPVHDPVSKELVGIIGLSNVSVDYKKYARVILEAVIVVIESELKIMTLRKQIKYSKAGASRPHAQIKQISSGITRLNVLGIDGGQLYLGSKTLMLTRRHAEILTLLAWHGRGLSADELSEYIYGHGDAAITLRAEMVRLRAQLKTFDVTLLPLSRPYRLPRAITLDIQDVLSFLDKGAHVQALSAYPGDLLPESEAPGILDIRYEIRNTLREALISDASLEVLLNYVNSPLGSKDKQAWRTCLQLLPPKSPKRAHIVSKLELLDKNISA